MIRLPETFTLEHSRLIAGWCLTIIVVAVFHMLARAASTSRGRAVLVALALIAA